LTRFGVLILGPFSALSARQAELFRSAGISTWTATSDFEVHWLVQRAAVSASIALVDLRPLTVDRDGEINRLASLAMETMLPVLLVGASDEETVAFRGVVERLGASATDEDVTAAILAMRDRS
jgi:hypothetical protein